MFPILMDAFVGAGVVRDVPAKKVVGCSAASREDD